jgi:aminopeptidase N
MLKSRIFYPFLAKIFYPFFVDRRTRFPLPKQDMIALPDFISGAMEHWGLINYREKLLLFDPRESSAENKDLIERVVAHEMAHQWFGNLVTMEWWTE